LSVAEANAGGTAERQAMFVSNARKYSDSANHPVTGRSGSATLAIQALLARDGSAGIDVVAGEWTGWTRARARHDDLPGGTILRSVQLKAFDPDGELQYTRIYNQVDAQGVSLAANGLTRGGRAQVQGVIAGADFARSGVVTVDAPVLLRPDLAVVSLRRAPRAVANSAVPIVAVVRELNGDVGAWADCVLYVDGLEADRAYGIWVDAGGTVTCGFMHMFRQTGTSPFEVRVERVAPGDYDAANNSVSGTMNVIFVPSAFYYDAAFEDLTSSFTATYESSWSNNDGRQGGESSSTEERSGRVQQSYLSAFMPRAVSFPLGELFGRQYTAFETAHQVLFRGLQADWTYEDPYVRSSCVSRGFDQPNTGRGWLYLCSNQLLGGEGPELGWTSVTYDRYAGDVMYASRGHSRYWDRDLGIEDVYSYNYSGQETFGRFVRYGLEYGFFLRVIDAGQIFTVNPFIALLPVEEVFRQPRTCWGWSDPWGSSNWCYESEFEGHGVRGWVFGEPSP
jgi:hypothetical protein